jgi:hypothetical protein
LALVPSGLVSLLALAKIDVVQLRDLRCEDGADILMTNAPEAPNERTGEGGRVRSYQASGPDADIARRPKSASSGLMHRNRPINRSPRWRGR